MFMYMFENNSNNQLSILTNFEKKKTAPMSILIRKTHINFLSVYYFQLKSLNTNPPSLL